MRIGIGKVTKELGIPVHMLHTWENRGWLGYQGVLKDPENNNQRVYSEEQLERIRFIHALIEDQRARGIKRTDLKEVEQHLLEKFGGEITPIKEETTLLPSTVEEFHQIMMRNNAMMAELMDELRQRDEETRQRDEQILDMLAKAEKEKAEMQSELQLIKDKLDKAVDYIQKQEEKEKDTDKKGFWKRILG